MEGTLQAQEATEVGMRKCWVYLGIANASMKLSIRLGRGMREETLEIRLGKEDWAFECQAREVGLYQSLHAKRIHH